MTTKLDQLRAEMVPALDSFLQMRLKRTTDTDVLQNAMTYSVMAGGKRLRPLLVLAVVQTFKPQAVPQALPVAAAIELLHTYSLIHDDLPAMDNDDLRRGLPTNHKKFGEAQAILAGDGLLTLAFQWLAESQLPAETRIDLVQELAVQAGPVGMVAGQSLDMLNQGKTLSLPELQDLHRRKTGALIKASVLMGAKIAAVNEQRTAALTEFATQFGLAFQIRDDILDVTATTAELGKPAHQDQDAEKNTYPGLLGLDGARQALTEALTGARQALGQLVVGTDTTLLNDFIDWLEK
jgi:geranylgeranyl diphosphate synthase type II